MKMSNPKQMASYRTHWDKTFCYRLDKPKNLRMEGLSAPGRTATIQIDAPPDCKQTLRFCLLCHFQRVVDFYAEVSNRAF